MKPTVRLRSFLAIASSSLLAVSSASAATYYWDSNSTTAGFGNTAGTWGSSAFWSTDSAGTAATANTTITSADSINFGTATLNYATSNVGVVAAGVTVGGIVMGAGQTTAINLGTSGNSITIHGGITKNAGSGQLSIVGPVILGAAQTWTNNSTTGGLITSNGTNLITNGGFQLTIDGTGNTRFGITNQTGSSLTGSGALVKNGTGMLEIGGQNTAFTGDVTLNGGILHYGDYTQALGSTNNILITNGIIEARWNAGITRAQGTGDDQIQITGGTSGFSGALSTVTFNMGNVTWGSATFNPTEFVLQSGNTGSGTGTFSSAIDLNGANRTIRSNQTFAGGFGSGVFSGNITNGSGTAAGLIKTGVGNHVLTGTNTYDGNTAVNQGALTAATTGALPGWNATGKISVASGAVLGVRVGTSWTSANIDTLLSNVTWASSTSALGFDTTGASLTYASNLSGAYSIVKYGSANTLTLDGNLSGLGGSLILVDGTIARTLASGNLVTPSFEVRNGTVSANIGGSTAVTKTTAGSVTLSGANTYSGGFTLNSGNVTMASGAYNGFGTGVLTVKGGQLTPNGAVISNAVTFDSATTIVVVGNTSMTFNGPITLAQSVAFNKGGTTNYNLTFNGNIGQSASSGITIGLTSGTATQTFTGQNTFTGNLTISSGSSLVISGSGYLGGGNYGGNITAGTLTYSSSANQTLSGNLSGATLVKNTSADSILTLSGTNSLSSTTTVTAGALIATKAASLSGYTTANRIIFNGGTIGAQVGGSGWTTAQVNTLLTNATKTSGALGIDTTNGDLTQWTAFTTTNLGSTLGLHKLGSNKLILDQTNTYTGATTVTAGTLAVNGSLANTTTTVKSGGTLQGSGTIGGSVTIQSGGTLAAGNSIQSLATGALSLEALSTFAYETDKSVALAAGGDLTAVTGNLTIAANAILTLTELNTFPLALGTWDNGEKLTLISYSGVWDGGLFNYLGANGGAGGALADDSTFSFDGVTWQFNYNDTLAGSNYTGDLTSDGITGRFVTMTVVPEPGAALIGGLGMLMLLRRRRI